ncbi:MAG: endonuclease/exonuclease/phosphatase family protein [Prevotella sp.]|nr:endonuclease/exonuclease/phosphatase family protein [Prevotella sp.]
MDLKKLKQRTRRGRTALHRALAALVTGASVLSVLLLWLCAASAYVRPTAVRGAGVIGLAFPLFLGGVALMLVLTLAIVPRRAWIPLAGLLGCAGSIRSYFPINLPRTAPEGSIKVLSWNVHGWGKWPDNFTDDLGHNLAAKYIGESGADIVCAQETFVCNGFNDTVLRKELVHTPYCDSIIMQENAMSIYSAYPILRRETVCAVSLNGAVAWWLQLAPRDTLIVINCHLASMHLEQDERDAMREAVRSTPDSAAGHTFRQLFRKIDRAAAQRADMADSVAAFLARNEGRSVLVLGDFNDTPISYARQRIGRRLTDAYRATATGFGRSFNRDGIIVRIDNILCSKDWEPYECRVDGSVSYSDHNPISCYLKRKRL